MKIFGYKLYFIDNSKIMSIPAKGGKTALTIRPKYYKENWTVFSNCSESAVVIYSLLVNNKNTTVWLTLRETSPCLGVENQGNRAFLNIHLK